MNHFRVRLNCIDHYQATWTRHDPQLRRSDARNPADPAKGPKVPIVRVFGATETGQRVCAHIHGAFPYLYVEYEGSLVPEEVGTYIYHLHTLIDHALAISYRHKDPAIARFVARITLVKGVPFYGFHVGYRFFLKIYIYTPAVMPRLADLLQQGVIMKRQFQPYEAHLSYILQFMADFNLYGYDYLEATRTWFRAPVPMADDDGGDGSRSRGRGRNRWNQETIPPESIIDDFNLQRISHCSLEVDICVQDIANRRTVKERRLHHDFIERVKPLRADLKLVPSLAGLWKDEARRRARKLLREGGGRNGDAVGSLLDASSSPFPLEALVPVSADPRNPQSQEWIHEREFRQRLDAIVDSEKGGPGAPPLSFDTFKPPVPFEDTVKTVFQSVEDLFPENLRAALGPGTGVAEAAREADPDPTSSIEVDEARARGMRYNDNDDDEALFPCEEKEEDENDGDDDNDSIDLVPNPGLDPLSQELERERRDRARARGEESPEKRERARSRPSGDVTPRQPSKRPASGLSTTRPPPKRSKTESAASENTPTTATARPGPRSSDAPRASPHNNHMLLYNTVKDPRELESRQRLSQKSQSCSPYSSQEQPSNPYGNPDQKQSTKPGLRRVYVFAPSPPSASEVCDSFQSLGIPDVVYQDAFYGDERDVPPRPREYAGKEFRLESNTVPFLPDFDPSGAPARPPDQQLAGARGENGAEGFGNGLCGRAGDPARGPSRGCSYRSWEFEQPPPSFDDVAQWDRDEQERERELRKKKGASRAPRAPITPKPAVQRQYYFSQVDGPTPQNKHAFKYSQRRSNNPDERREAQYMSIMSVEVHVNTRGKLLPDPAEDEIQCIFWALKADDGQDSTNGGGLLNGIVVLAPPAPSNVGDGEGELQHHGCLDIMIRQLAPDSVVVGEDSELDLLVRLVEIVRTHDPDILAGYEVHGGSWGYLIERARARYDYDLCDDLARTKRDSHGRFGRDNDRWGFNTTSSVRITGRHMINVWRAMRAELGGLVQYTLENVAWHLLHRRVPHYSWPTLTRWHRSGRPRDLHRLVRHFSARARLDIAILDANDLVARTSEQARLLGVDFFSVFSRGSQFKVESIMFRIAKPENLVLVSPSRAQVGRQNALECLPLVMEPLGGFYTSPVVVLDFQSLYPSVMIAYNYCYSTFLGRTTAWKATGGRSGGTTTTKMGFADYRRDSRLLELLVAHGAVTLAPNGMVYAKGCVRRSLLAKMLTEILETRVMVKTGMKHDKHDKALLQLLNNRQLALKLLANVTYGYASASFSGRMPCAEVADSIVQTGRETLERAIALIHSVDRWAAEVVYGDTDSLFVHLPGRTREQAFILGAEMARAVTAANPRPVKLKFEKVYHPCVLLAKKRYVGYKFESPDQTLPEFEAKGIETVRRDGTPAEQKIEERALRLLFDSSDLSAVKAYFQQQCDKLMRGAVSIADFCFAREVKLGTYSESGRAPPPPGALVSTRRMRADARAEPQYGERVPYVVVTGAPGARLADRCVAPEDLLANPHTYALDADYYISKNLVPPLERIFNLVGANVRTWYDEMPKAQRMRRVVAPQSRRQGQPETLETFIRSSACLVCGTRLARSVIENHNRNFDGRDDSRRPNSADLPPQLATLICPACASDVPTTVLTLRSRLSREEHRYADLVRLCRSCEGSSSLPSSLSRASCGSALGPEVLCESMDCPVYFTRKKQASVLRVEKDGVEPVLDLLADWDCGGVAGVGVGGRVGGIVNVDVYGDW